MYKRILVPLDGSAIAEAVLPHAQNVARMHNAELRLLRVIVFPAPGTTIAEAELAARFRDEVDDLHAEAREYVERMAAALRADGFAARGETRAGDICRTILQAAGEWQCDLIAMSTHGRSGSARWLLGSIADRVVRTAHIPVLLIRPHFTMSHVKQRRDMQSLVSESRWI